MCTDLDEGFIYFDSVFGTSSDVKDLKRLSFLCKLRLLSLLGTPLFHVTTKVLVVNQY